MNKMTNKFKMATAVGATAVAVGVAVAPAANAQYILRTSINSNSSTTTRTIGLTDGQWAHVQIDLETQSGGGKPFVVQVLQNGKVIKQFAVNTNQKTVTNTFKTNGSWPSSSSIQYKFIPMSTSIWGSIFGAKDIGAYINTY